MGWSKNTRTYKWSEKRLKTLFWDRNLRQMQLDSLRARAHILKDNPGEVTFIHAREVLFRDREKIGRNHFYLVFFMEREPIIHQKGESLI